MEVLKSLVTSKMHAKWENIIDLGRGAFGLFSRSRSRFSHTDLLRDLISIPQDSVPGITVLAWLVQIIF